MRGYSGKTRQIVKIALAKSKYKKPRKILYFKMILLRLYKNRWRHIVVFDTFHKGKVYVHGHRRVGKTIFREDIEKIPLFDNLTEGCDWVRKHLDSNWRSYVTMFFNDIKRIKNENK